MLTAMRIQALDYLFRDIENGNPPNDLENWYLQIKKEAPEEIFQYLVEDSGNVKTLYIIEKREEDQHPRLYIEEVRDDIKRYLPFIKSPSNGPQFGTLFKRTYNASKKTFTPQPNRIKLTINNFIKIAEQNEKWASYFAEISDLLALKIIQLADGRIINCDERGYAYCLDYIVQEIDDNKDTSFVTVKDKNGRLPGQVPEYIEYLTKEFITGKRYLTKKIQAKNDTVCSLCGKSDIAVFPNALSGAGINLTNVDRAGRFPGMHIANAWKGFSACADCADLLYIYKNHALKKRGPKKNIRPFTAPIAGDTALVIPACTTEPSQRFQIWDSVNDYIVSAQKGDVGFEEETLLDILRQQKGLLNLTFLWCTIGQSLEKVTGVITDVPPSRLNQLSDFNEEETPKWKHPFFPKMLLKDARHDLTIDLTLKGFKSLFYRPGGKKAPNLTRRLSELKRLLAEAVYHGKTFSVKNQKRLWDEIVITAQWWWRDAVKRGETYGLLNPGKGKNGPYLTAAGWVRHWAWWLYYFKKLGVLQMENKFYEPQWDELNAYMGPESGIDSQAKAFAFLLGVIYGRLIFLQESAGFRVSVLTWVKRFTIDGHDLPELYKKVQAKLLEYRQVPDEKSKKMFTKNFHKVVEESALLGARLGDRIELNSNLTCYYLLLGLSLSNKIIKKKENDA